MPVVTQVVAQKSKKRVNIFIDDEFSFGLDLENLLKFGIRKGKILEEKDIKKIIKEAEFAKVYQKIVRFGVVRPRSEWEFRNWIKKYSVDSRIHEDLLAKLTDMGLLDDLAFAKWWVTQRTNFKPKAKRVLEMELKQKGLSDSPIKSALREIQVDEVSLGVDILQKKARQIDRMPADKKRQKMVQILRLRGFDMDVIRKVMKSISEPEY